MIFVLFDVFVSQINPLWRRLLDYNVKRHVHQKYNNSGLCQPFLGALITPVNPALYFCTLLRLPRDIRRLVSYSSRFVLQTKNQTGRIGYEGTRFLRFTSSDEWRVYRSRDDR